MKTQSKHNNFLPRKWISQYHLQYGGHFCSNLDVQQVNLCPTRAWASYQICKNCGLRMRRECRERFPRHQLQRNPLVSDPGMHPGTCVTHVPWFLSGSPTGGWPTFDANSNWMLHQSVLIVDFFRSYNCRWIIPFIQIVFDAVMVTFRRFSYLSYIFISNSAFNFIQTIIYIWASGPQCPLLW